MTDRSAPRRRFLSCAALLAGMALLALGPTTSSAGDAAKSAGLEDSPRGLPTMTVGNRTCLFLDDHFIAEQTGSKRTWHQGKPHPQAVVAETEPWEHWILLHGRCIYDPKSQVYRMYYQSSHQPSGAPGISFLDLICYAESKDGKTWTRPKLGLVEFKGSKDNNIVMEFAGPSNVFLDPLAKDPAGRLKMLTYVLRKQPATSGQVGLCWLQSGDGIRWKYTGPVSIPTFANPDEGGFNDLFIV